MACARFLTWASIPFLFILLVGSADGLGVNWGTMASHPLPPNVVVNMLKDNNFTQVKLFDADSWTVSALAGSGIEVMLAIPNMMLTAMNDYDNAQDWVKENVTKHIYDGGVDIKYVAVGNEPFLKSYNGSFLKTTFPALRNIQRALNEAGLSKIKATVPLNADVYDSKSQKPSDGDFRQDIKAAMLQIVMFLNANGAPFVVNIYPFLSLQANADFPVDFAFFDGAKSVSDKNLSYDNVYEANFDTLVWSLTKAGVGKMKILVGEIGWPTEADKSANLKLAKRFYDGYFKKLAGSNPGTPMRPEPADAYLFGLLDEDQKSVAPGNFERHWGIFQYDGKPKFEIDFSGKGGHKLPVGAKGVEYLPSQWCVLKSGKVSPSQVQSNINYACASADCTSLGYGSACNNLDYAGNVSYAFNAYYQIQDQSVEACDFEGLAKIVTQNASQNGCLFPVQIVSAAGKLAGYSAAAALAGLVSLLALL